MHIIESGNVAAATGVKLARAQVIAAYPITPQTPLTEKLSEFVESGQLAAQYIPVESEHSAMAVCIAASTAGTHPGVRAPRNGEGLPCTSYSSASDTFRPATSRSSAS